MEEGLSGDIDIDISWVRGCGTSDMVECQTLMDKNLDLLYEME